MSTNPKGGMHGLEIGQAENKGIERARCEEAKATDAKTTMEPNPGQT